MTKLPVPNTASPDTIRAMPVEMFFDFLGVRLNGDRAAGLTLAFNLELTDTNEKYVLGVENAAIHYSKDRSLPDADASIVMTRDALNDVMLGTATMEKQIVAGKAKLTGDPKKLADLRLPASTRSTSGSTSSRHNAALDVHYLRSSDRVQHRSPVGALGCGRDPAGD